MSLIKEKSTYNKGKSVDLEYSLKDSVTGKKYADIYFSGPNSSLDTELLSNGFEIEGREKNYRDRNERYNLYTEVVETFIYDSNNKEAIRVRQENVVSYLPLNSTKEVTETVYTDCVENYTELPELDFK